MTTTTDTYDKLLSSIEQIDGRIESINYNTEKEKVLDRKRADKLYSKMYKEFESQTEEERNAMEVLYAEHLGALTQSEAKVLKIMESVNRVAELNKEQAITRKILQRWEVEIRDARRQERSEEDARLREARTRAEIEETRILYAGLKTGIDAKSKAEVDRLQELYSKHEDALTETEREVLNILNTRSHLEEVKAEKRVSDNARAEFERAKEKAKEKATQRADKALDLEMARYAIKNFSDEEKESIKTRYSENKELLSAEQQAMLLAIEHQQSITDKQAKNQKMARDQEVFDLRERLESSSVMKFIKHPGKFVGTAIVSGLKSSPLGRGLESIKKSVSESGMGKALGKVNKKLGVTKEALGSFFEGSITGRVGKFLLTGISGKLTSVISSIFPYKNVVDFMLSPIGITLMTFVYLWFRIKVLPVITPILAKLKKVYDWVIETIGLPLWAAFRKNPAKVIGVALATYFTGKLIIMAIAKAVGTAIMGLPVISGLMGALGLGGAAGAGAGAGGGLLAGALGTAGTAIGVAGLNAFGATTLGGIAAAGAGATAVAGAAIVAAGGIGIGAGMLLDKAFGISDSWGEMAGNRQDKKDAKKYIKDYEDDFHKGKTPKGVFPDLGKYFRAFMGKLGGYDDQDDVEKARIMAQAWQWALKRFYKERNAEQAAKLDKLPKIPLPPAPKPAPEVVSKPLVGPVKPLSEMIPKKPVDTSDHIVAGVPVQYIDPVTNTFRWDRIPSKEDATADAEAYANWRYHEWTQMPKKGELSDDLLVQKFQQDFDTRSDHTWKARLDASRKSTQAMHPSPVGSLKDAKDGAYNKTKTASDAQEKAKEAKDEKKLNTLQDTVVKAVDKSAEVTTTIVNNNKVAPVQVTVPERGLFEASPLSYA